MADEPAPTPTPTPTPPPPAPTPASEPLGEPGLRALQVEREARAEAERQARELKRERDALTSQLSDTDRVKHEAEEQRKLAAKAVKQLRSANLELALATHGLTGPKAKAATKLIEGVEYDEEFRPTNLSNRLDAAKATYGEDLFAAVTPTPPAPSPTPTPSPAAPAPVPTPQSQLPNVHNGARQPAADDEEALFAMGMDHFFPGTLPQPSK